MYSNWRPTVKPEKTLACTAGVSSATTSASSTVVTVTRADAVHVVAVACILLTLLQCCVQMCCWLFVWSAAAWGDDDWLGEYIYQLARIFPCFFCRRSAPPIYGTSASKTKERTSYSTRHISDRMWSATVPLHLPLPVSKGQAAVLVAVQHPIDYIRDFLHRTTTNEQEVGIQSRFCASNVAFLCTCDRSRSALSPSSINARYHYVASWSSAGHMHLRESVLQGTQRLRIYSVHATSLSFCSLQAVVAPFPGNPVGGTSSMSNTFAIGVPAGSEHLGGAILGDHARRGLLKLLREQHSNRASDPLWIFILVLQVGSFFIFVPFCQNVGTCAWFQQGLSPGFEFEPTKKRRSQRNDRTTLHPTSKRTNGSSF